MSEQKLTGYPAIDKPWLKYYDSKFLTDPIPKMNIFSYLRAMTDACDNLTAISYYGREISYREFFCHIDESAKTLISMGAKSGDRVMYLMPNIPETAYFLYGGARIGTVSIYVDPRPDSTDNMVSAQKILNLFKEEHVKFLVALDLCYITMLQPIELELKKLGVKEIVLVSASDSMNRKAKFNYLHEIFSFEGFKALKKSLQKTKNISDLMADAKRHSNLKLQYYSELKNRNTSIELPPVYYVKECLAIVVHTSGTTSAKPKPIPLTHDNLNFYAHQTLGANMPMRPGDRAFHILPYFAAFGVVNVVHALLCHKSNLVQIPEFSPRNFGRQIIKYKPQIIIGAPSWFLSLLKDPALKNADLSCLTMMTYGGDSMTIDDEIKVNKFLNSHCAKCTLTKGHGMSETCGCASYAIGDYNNLGGIGIPMPLTTYAIVDPETKEMLRFEDSEDFIEGELAISSGAITPGALDGNIIVPHHWYNGERYILSHDIARMYRDGSMIFLSRSDRSITRFDGYKIKPHEVENVIKCHKNVQYCIISPLYDIKKFGFVAIADIVLQGGVIPLRETQLEIVKDLIQRCFTDNENVSSRQIPAWFRFRSYLPLTANSKIDYMALAKEPLRGDEIAVNIEETNISIDKITVE